MRILYFLQIIRTAASIFAILRAAYSNEKVPQCDRGGAPVGPVGEMLLAHVHQITESVQREQFNSAIQLIHSISITDSYSLETSSAEDTGGAKRKCTDVRIVDMIFAGALRQVQESNSPPEVRRALASALGAEDTRRCTPSEQLFDQLWDIDVEKSISWVSALCLAASRVGAAPIRLAASLLWSHLDPHSDQSLQQTGFALVQSHQNKAALHFFQEAVRIARHAGVPQRLAAALVNFGAQAAADVEHRPMARDAFAEAAAIDPCDDLAAANLCATSANEQEAQQCIEQQRSVDLPNYCADAAIHARNVALARVAAAVARDECLGARILAANRFRSATRLADKSQCPLLMKLTATCATKQRHHNLLSDDSFDVWGLVQYCDSTLPTGREGMAVASTELAANVLSVYHTLAQQHPAHSRNKVEVRRSWSIVNTMISLQMPSLYDTVPSVIANVRGNSDARTGSQLSRNAVALLSNALLCIEDDRTMSARRLPVLEALASHLGAYTETLMGSLWMQGAVVLVAGTAAEGYSELAQSATDALAPFATAAQSAALAAVILRHSPLHSAAHTTSMVLLRKLLKQAAGLATGILIAGNHAMEAGDYKGALAMFARVAHACLPDAVRSAVVPFGDTVQADTGELDKVPMDCTGLQTAVHRWTVVANALHAARHAADVRAADRLSGVLLPALHSGDALLAMQPFEAHFVTAVTRPILRAIALEHARTLPTGQRGGSGCEIGSRVRRSSRVRVVGVSSDLRSHPTLHVLLAVLRRLAGDPRVAIVLVATGHPPPEHDLWRRELAAFAEIRDVSGMDRHAAIAAVCREAPDIVFDAGGFMRGAAPALLAALRLHVPVVNLAVYPTSMSDRLVHAVIADPVVAPPEYVDEFSERVIYLPHAYLPHSWAEDLDAPRAASDRGPHRARACSAHQVYKIDTATAALWRSAVPDDVPFLTLAAEDAFAALRSALPTGALLWRRVSRAAHLARFARDCDVHVDTASAVGAHMTCMEAMLAGVIPVTLAGDHFASRVCASLLVHAGAPWLVASSATEFAHTVRSLLACAPCRTRALKQLASVREDDQRRYTESLITAFHLLVDLHASARPKTYHIIVARCA